MAPKKAVYGPPMSDSEDDMYDGYYFGEVEKKAPRAVIQKTKYEELEEALYDNDLESLKSLMAELQFDVDAPLANGYTMLMMACMRCYIDIVEYLLCELNANPNAGSKGSIPLHMVLENEFQDQDKIEAVEKIVKMLLRFGSGINFSSKFGVTPFMLACRNGYRNVVELLVTKVSTEAEDNNGNSPLIYAISYNRREIVEILLKNGFDTAKKNRKGYTPTDVARMYGFDDILAMLPKEKKNHNELPTTYVAYSSFKDYVPQIFLKSNCPDYFPDIYNLLTSLCLEKFLPILAEKNVSLERFLRLRDEDFADVGIELDFNKQLIKKAILCYYLGHWNESSIVPPKEYYYFYNFLVVAARQLRKVLIIKCTLEYVRKNLEEGVFGSVDVLTVNSVSRTIAEYKGNLDLLQSSLKFVQPLCAQQNPLFIDYDETLKKENRRKIKRFFQYSSLILGFSLLVCWKFKKTL